MWNVSLFMKVLKQRFTQWYNKQHQRTGTLWESRFSSSIVEAGGALKEVAAYIDLNPVRAKVCEDPKDYRWSGYAEALGGGELAREAVRFMTSLDRDGKQKHTRDMKASLECWRRILFGITENEDALEYFRGVVKKADEHYGEEGSLVRREADRTLTCKKRISREKALEVLQNGGTLSKADYLCCRVRYFCDGKAIGTKSFIEDLFQSNREKFSKKRKDGARLVKGRESDEQLYSLRDLQKNVFS